MTLESFFFLSPCPKTNFEEEKIILFSEIHFTSGKIFQLTKISPIIIDYSNAI